jgi:5-methylcytosine-specific restriction protein B
VTGSYRYEEGRAEYRHLRDVDWKKSGHWIENNGPISSKTLTNITIYPTYAKRLVRLLGITEVTREELDDLTGDVERHAPLIARYKQMLRLDGNKDERYKWQALQHFQQHFDLDAEDFGASFKEAIAKQQNLLFNRSAMFLRSCADAYPEELREALMVLLNEQEVLHTRFKQYDQHCNNLLTQLKELQGNDNIGHYQDERSKVFFLAMRYPERYFVYKDDLYQYLLKLSGEPSANTGGKYYHYHSIMDSLHEILCRDQELLQLSRSTLDDTAYQGDSTRLMAQDLVFRNMREDKEEEGNATKEDIQENYQDVSMINEWDYPLNQILYGPPGTGKTYHTIDLAAKIIGFDTGDHDTNLEAFNKRLGKNIEFVTFHQSFTYEDFVEGIKPETAETKDRGKQVTYEVQDGIFKQMAKRAEKAGLNRETQAAQVEFERAFEALRSEVEASETDEIEIPMRRVSYHITAIGNNAISFRKHSGGTGHTLSIDTLRKIYTGVLDYPNNGLGIYYHPLVDYLREKSQTAPQTAAEKTEVPHVLIIDEINRGNVAAILGELITLIETDKRSGGKHPLRLTLPYSKAEFSVPSNLYLIGTMNTADRSVEALDTALRRRFSFTEVGPQPELLSPKSMIVRLLNVGGYADLYWEEEPYHSHALKLYDFLGVERDLVEAPLKKKMEELPEGEGIYWVKEDLSHLTANHFKGIQLDRLLRVINSRIARLIDRDHMIGHAYFMGIATAIDPWQALKAVFHRNLLPLLQEYFFGDHGKIGLVLGNGFVVKEKAEAEFGFATFDHPSAGDFSDRIVYRLADVAEMDMDLFREGVRAILPATQTESND